MSTVTGAGGIAEGVGRATSGRVNVVDCAFKVKRSNSTPSCAKWRKGTRESESGGWIRQFIGERSRLPSLCLQRDESPAALEKCFSLVVLIHKRVVFGEACQAESLVASSCWTVTLSASHHLHALFVTKYARERVHAVFV